jgi:hypothetical protein
VEGKLLCLVNTDLLDLCRVDVRCAVTGLCTAFVGGDLKVFDEVNFYIFSHSFIERVFCGYMKSAV